MKKDVDRIMAVMSAAFDPHYGEAWSRRQVEDALQIGNCRYILSNESGSAPQDEERTVGFAMTRLGFEEEELLLLAVDPDYRGAGLGLSLLETLCSDAKERGAKRILLEMRRDNPAEFLYRKLGFTQIGERRDYYRTQTGGRIDAITFAKDLN